MDKNNNNQNPNYDSGMLTANQSPNYDSGNNYNYNYGGMKKSNTGLIIALFTSIFIFLSVTTILIFVLVKGGKNNKTTETSTVTSEITTAADTTEETTEAVTEAATETTTEATTEAPPPVPYAEEHGYANWSDPYAGLELPTYHIAYYEDESPVPSNLLSVADSNAVYTFGDITKSEPYDNGYVTITVPYTIYTYKECTNHGVYEYYYVNYYQRNFTISDYYTGIRIKSGYNYDTNEFPSDFKYTEVTYGNQTVSIGLLVSFENISPEYTSAASSNTYESYSEYRYTLTFLVPADYDGLVFSIPAYGYTEDYYNSTMVGDDSQTYYALGPDNYGWSYSPDELYFIKINDYIK